MKKKQYKVIAIVGMSGSGKTTLFNLFKETKMAQTTNQIIQYTTRPKRDNEIQDREYHFLESTQDYIAVLKTSNILEEMSYKGWHYFTTFDELSLNKINIGVFNPEAIMSMGNNKEIDLYTFEIVADQKIRLNRILTRNNKADIVEAIRRTLSDKKSCQTMRDFILNNADIFSKYEICQNNFPNELLTNLEKLESIVFNAMQD